MRSIVVIAHNLRSTHNVGSLLRTAEGLGVKKVFMTGYTPYPFAVGDDRLPHIAKKVHAAIIKTALGAESLMTWQHYGTIEPVISQLRADGYTIAAVEQTDTAVDISRYNPPDKLALIVGREVEGIEAEVLADSDLQLVIPMHGQKESFNVVQAAAMVLYHCRFYK